MIVLHVQKVAGISGSEAHLLSLLPRLRQRGWDIRMLMLHEHEPGAWDFARTLEARGVPLDAIPLAQRRRPGHVRARRRVPGPPPRPTILHTHLVHADAYGQIAGTLARVPVRLSTKHGFNEFREGAMFALGDRTIGAPRARAHRDLARPRALPGADRGLPRARASRSSTTGSRPTASRSRTPAPRRASSASAA